MQRYPHMSGILMLGVLWRICVHEFDLVLGLDLNAHGLKTAELVRFLNLRKFV